MTTYGIYILQKENKLRRVYQQSRCLGFTHDFESALSIARGAGVVFAAPAFICDFALPRTTLGGI